MSKEEKKKTKRSKKRRSIWFYYWIALPLALGFMVFEISQAVGLG
jgi:hypothetical protein